MRMIDAGIATQDADIINVDKLVRGVKLHGEACSLFRTGPANHTLNGSKMTGESATLEVHLGVVQKPAQAIVDVGIARRLRAD